MKIGAVADTAGVTTKTVRYYESIGLLPAPGRTASGYRDYPESVLPRLRFIRDAQASGLTLTEIHSVLDMKDSGERTSAHTLDLLERHIAEIDDQIERLRTARRELAGYARRARNLDPADCSDPDRCQVIDAATEREETPRRLLTEKRSP